MEAQGVSAPETEAARASTCLLVLVGLPGAGKSTLAAALAHEAEQDDVQVLTVSFDDPGCHPAGGGTSGGTGGGSSGSDGGGRAEATADFSPEAWQRARHDALAQVQAALAVGSSAGAGGSRCERQQQPTAGLAADGTQQPAPATPAQQAGMQQHRLVIADDNMHFRSMRWQAYSLARSAGAAAVLLHVRCTEAEAQRRNAARPPGQRVPPAVITRMAAQLEEPGRSSSRAAEGSGSSSGSGCASSGSDGGGSSTWERGCTVVWDSRQPIHEASTAQLWQQVWQRWGPPAPPPHDARAAAAALAAAQAATAASLAHAVDLATRQVLRECMQRVAAGQRGSAAGAAAQQLNGARRRLLREVAAAPVEGATGGGVDAAARRWAEAYRQRCAGILAGQP